jgi:endogenous inhibitor of DNA gyrase (YacG/DUF329 family)
MSEGRSEMRAAPGTQGPLVKLLVEGFHSPCTACIRLVEWRDRNHRNFVDPHNQPINFSSPGALHVRGAGEDGCPRHPRAPLKLLVEGFHSPCTACIRLVEWRDRKSRNF